MASGKTVGSHEPPDPEAYIAEKILADLRDLKQRIDAHRLRSKRLLLAQASSSVDDAIGAMQQQVDDERL